MAFQRSRFWILTALDGAAVYFGVFLFLKSFTHLGSALIQACELAVISLYFLVRPLTLPSGCHRDLRKGLMLLAMLPGFFGAMILLSAWRATAPYAWLLMIAGIAVFFGVIRPYIKRVVASIRKSGRPGNFK